MAVNTYYIAGGTGSDLNGGTGPGDAWATTQHALDNATPGSDGTIFMRAPGGAEREVVGTTLTFATFGSPPDVAQLWMHGDGGVAELEFTTQLFENGADNIGFLDMELDGNGKNDLCTNNAASWNFIRCYVHDFGGLLEDANHRILFSRFEDFDDAIRGVNLAYRSFFRFEHVGGSLFPEITNAAITDCVFVSEVDDNLIETVNNRCNIVGNTFFTTAVAPTSSAVLIGGGQACILNNTFVGFTAAAAVDYGINDNNIHGNNLFYNNLSNYTGTGSTQPIADIGGDITTLGDPFTNSAGEDFTISDALGQGTAEPGANIPGLATTADARDVGGVQRDPSTPDYPVVGDVRNGISYDSGNLTGTLDLPAVTDVRLGTDFDNALQTGTLNLPAPGDVVLGVDYDNGNQTGTFDADCPDASDVRDGVEFSNGSETGGLVVPAQVDVRCGVQYDNPPNAKTGKLEPRATQKKSTCATTGQYERANKTKACSPCGHILLDNPCVTDVEVCDKEEE